MSLEEALAESTEDTPFFTNWQVVLKDSKIDEVKGCLDAMSAPIVAMDDPRTGVITYAYSQTEQHRGSSLHENKIHFTELFTDLESHRTHLTESEGEPVVELFKCIKHRISVYVNAPYWHEGIKSDVVSNGGTGTRASVGYTLNPHPKGLLGGKYGRKVLPPGNQAVMFQLRIEPSAKEASEKILKLLSPLTEITKTDTFVVSSYIIQGPGWWRRNPDKKLPVKLKTKGPTLPADCYTKSFGSPLTIEFQMICSTSMGLRHKFSRQMVTELVAEIEASLSSEFIITGENLEDETLQELVEYFEDNKLFTSDRRSLLSGFLLHPFYTKDWNSSTGTSNIIANATKKEQTAQSTKKTAQSMAKNLGIANALEGALGKRLGLVRRGKQEVAANNEEPSPKAFHIRYHRVKQAPEAVVLEARSKRIPLDVGGDGSSTKFCVPLVDFLRTVTRVGHSDKEIPIGTLFGVLERMRSMLADVAYVNSLGSMKEEERETLVNIERFKRVFTKLALMGRGEYQKRHFGKKQLEIDSLEELICVIEKEYSVLVERGRKAVFDCSSIEYMSLQELYKIGSIVITRSIPSLGGLQASFKVLDCMYEPIRSLMGSLRYSFRVTFEAIVWMGKHFVSVHFQEVIGDWRNTKPIRSLHYQPSTFTVSASSTTPTNLVSASSTDSVSASLPRWISERIQLLNDVCSAEETFTYMEYPAGSFFPSLSRQMRVRGKSSGAASSSITRSGAGQLVVDVLTGISLGYAAASRTGDFGNALSLTTKLYLDYLRKVKGSKISLEDLNNSHEGLFTAYETFPKGINAQPWPCVIGFSMNVKSWGYALIDRLRPVLPDPRPWLELVLPPATKEMLLSLTKSKVKFSSSAQHTTSHAKSTSRYRYEDVIPGKGTGGLYLLYGPPGTGKTLTVEALARFFGKPLYSISFAERGSSTAELEETLTETLHLAGHWGCLALLDEGDALVEKRKQGQLLLNSMTGVLLRLLENFEGSLFINSNRVSSFDPAALSRVTLAVKFTPLSTIGMYHVWRNSIARVLKSDTTRPTMTYEDAVAEAEKNFDLDTLAKFPGSGRSIGAVMKMAIAISSSRDCELTNGVIQECADNFLSFHNDLKGEGVQLTWD